MIHTHSPPGAMSVSMKTEPGSYGGKKKAANTTPTHSGAGSRGYAIG